MIETRAGDQQLEGIANPPNTTMRWVICVDPTPGEVDALAAAFDIHPLAVEDIQTRNQRPKVDEYEDRRQIFVVLRREELQQFTPTVRTPARVVGESPRRVLATNR